MKIKILILLIIVVSVGSYFYFGQSDDHEEFHEHADIKIYLDGNTIDLSQDKYQSGEDKKLDSSIHLHDGDGDIIHAHEKNITLEHFFTSLGMQFTDTCFTLDTKERYCSDEENTLEMYVNGKKNKKMEQYIFDDLDQILIFYGEGDINQLLETITDRSCIYSGKCPERGTAPEEGCVTGGGCELVY